MNHPSLKETAYNLIKDKLLNLEFSPGSRIREDLLAEEISMSRTPVREAVNQLVREGLINDIPRKGLFFIEMTKEEINDLIDVRLALESLAVMKCIERIDEKGLKGLEDILKATEENFKRGEYKICNEMDSQFHQEISKLAGNRKLFLYLKEIENFMRIVRNIEKMTMAGQKIEKSLEQHWDMYYCIMARDNKAAVEAVVRNIEQLRLHLGLAK
jgi:DNA-binding GntR family transcriptional regulator